MALPVKALTAGQTIVLDVLLRDYAEALAAVEEYARQAALMQGIDIVKDYNFDISTKTFIERIQP